MSDTNSDTERDQTPNFEALSLALQARPLQLEGGNIIVRLGTGPHDALLLHGDVLASASERFAARLNSSHWEPTREVGRLDAKDGEGKVVKVFEYHLAIVEDTFCLTDEKEASSKGTSVVVEGIVQDAVARNDASYSSFAASSLVEGYRGSAHGVYLSNKVKLAQGIYEHKVLFSMLYHNIIELDMGTSLEAVATLSDLVALADYYLLLPSLADRLDARFQSVPDFWKIVAQCPETYIALGTKLRSYKIFDEAMHHLVGRSMERSQQGSLFHNGFIDEDVLRQAESALGDMRDLAKNLTRELREIALTWYQAHPEAETRRKRGPEVHTTWLAADLRMKTLEDKCRWIAASIYREKLDQLMYGDEHWSHVEYIRNGGKGGKGGNVEAGSLFIACKTLMAARNAPKTLDVFGRNAVSKFAAMFNLRRTPQKIPARIIAGELRRLVNKAVHSIQYWLPIAGARPNQYARVEPAIYQDVEYFTGVRGGYYPWPQEPPTHQDLHGAQGDEEDEEEPVRWGELRVGVEAVAASGTWLELMGI